MFDSSFLACRPVAHVDNLQQTWPAVARSQRNHSWAAQCLHSLSARAEAQQPCRSFGFLKVLHGLPPSSTSLPAAGRLSWRPCDACSSFLVFKLQHRLFSFCVLCLQEGEAQLKALRRLQRQAQDSFAHLVSFFGENPQALASDADFWSEVSLFVQRFSSCQRQLRKQKLVSCPALWPRLHWLLVQQLKACQRQHEGKLATCPAVFGLALAVCAAIWDLHTPAASSEPGQLPCV